MTIESYLIINIKKLMDLKYFSVAKILWFYGLFGTAFTSLFSLVTTFISCGKKNNEIYDIYDYQCIIRDNEGYRYIENYKVYFNGDCWKDLLYTILGAIAYALYIYFLFKIVQYLNPIYKSFSLPLFYFFEKIFLLYQINGNETKKYLNVSFFIDLSSDISAIIGFLIYLEIIELNFCDLNKNLRKYIITRGRLDSDYYDIESENESDKSSSIESDENSNKNELGNIQ